MTVFSDIYSVWKKTGKICDLIVLRPYKKRWANSTGGIGCLPMEGQLWK
jgi:hypothetical protein